MAKILQGILHDTTGKVGPVIAQKWKGINYIKSYVIPRDPKSAAQLSHRAIIEYITHIGKLNYFDLIKLTFLSGCAGQNFSSWNLFLRENVKQGDVLADNSKLQISYGDLKSAPVDYYKFTKPVNTVHIAWDESISGNASAADRIWVFVLYANSYNLLAVSPENLKRSDAVLSFTNQVWSEWQNSTVLIYAENSAGLFSITSGMKIVEYVP